MDPSLTLSNISIDPGLLDITCTDLISSPEGSPTKKESYDDTLCSCKGDGDSDQEEHEHHGSIEISRGGDLEKSEDTSNSLSNPANHEAAVEEQERSSPLVSSVEVASELKKISASHKLSMFNETSFDLDKFMEEHKFNINKSFDSGDFSHLRLSFADATDFYSLHAGSIQDFADDSGEDENAPNGKELVVKEVENDVVEVNEGDGKVRYGKQWESILKEKNRINDFLTSNGELNPEKVHQQVVEIEKGLVERDTILKGVMEVLDTTVKEKQETEHQNQQLKDKIQTLQLKIQETQVRRTMPLIQIPAITTPEPDVTEQSDTPNSELEDLKLQILNLEKKLEADRKWLDLQTAEREMETDAFQKRISELEYNVDEMKRDKAHLENLISNQKCEIEDYEVRLKEEGEARQEAANKSVKTEAECKAAIEKVMELRDIIRDLENKIDVATKGAADLKDENVILHEEIGRLEQQITKEVVHNDPVEACNHQCAELCEELPAQVQDLFHRMERKVQDMDVYQWSTRPNSACSNAVSTEDISVARDAECSIVNTQRDVATQLATGIHKLDTLFESLIRFEEVIMKKLRDAELRLSNSKKSQEELENEKAVLQDKVKIQFATISDLQGCIDKCRQASNAPANGTLSGLRSRITTLTNENEELLAKVQIFELETRDLRDKLAEKDVMLKRALQRPPEMATYVAPKYNVGVQTSSKLLRVPSMNVSCQTDTNDNRNKQLASSGAQTVISGVRSADPLDISHIQGSAPVTHSTPNEATSSKSLPRTDRGSLWSDAIAEGYDANHTPEILREPADSHLNHSVISDRYQHVRNKQILRLQEDAQAVPIPVRPSASSHKDTQTPPLALDGLVNALDDEDKKNLLRKLSTGTMTTSGTVKQDDLATADEATNEEDVGELFAEADEVDEVPVEISESEPAVPHDLLANSDSSKAGLSEAVVNSDPSEADVLESVVNSDSSEADVSRAVENSHLSEADVGSSSQVFTSPSVPATNEDNQVGTAADADTGYQAQAIPFSGVQSEELNSREGAKEERMNEANCKGELEAVKAQVRTLQEALELEKKNKEFLEAELDRLCEEYANAQITAPKQTEATQTGEEETSGLNARDSRIGASAVPDSTEAADETSDHDQPISPPPGPQPQDWNSLERAKEERMNEADCRTELEAVKTQMTMLQEALCCEIQKKDALEAKMAEIEQEAQEMRRLIDLNNQQLQTEREMRESRQISVSVQNPSGSSANVNTGTNSADAALIDEMRRLQDMNSSSTSKAVVPVQSLMQGDSRLQQAQENYAGNEQQVVASKGNSQRWYELYMRAKSYRKALAWQKKYLGIVIHGYKDLLTHTAGAYEHPDLLQKEIPITPSSVGLCTSKQGKARFRIYVKVVLASLRMKYMVNRWSSKSHHRPPPMLRRSAPSDSSRYASGSSNSDCESTEGELRRSERAVRFAPETTSPISKGLTGSRSSYSSLPMTNSDVSTQPPSAFKHPVPVSRPPLLTAQREEVVVQGESLSAYFERFQTLQNDIGSALTRNSKDSAKIRKPA